MLALVALLSLSIIRWAAVIKYNPSVLAQFNAFRERKDTFSLGVCNGCQFLALLGWIPQLDQGKENGAYILI